MNNSDQPKKKLKKKLQPNTNRGLRSQKPADNSNDRGAQEPPLCPLAAKDSEWIDVLKVPRPRQPSTSLHGFEEKELQIVKHEDVPAIRPVTLLFPGLLERDPETVQGIYSKVMSTTDVTKRLVDLGQKANFTFMNKTPRLIPSDKKWLECVTENSNSLSSSTTTMHNHGLLKNSDYDADAEGTDEEDKATTTTKVKRIKKKRSVNNDCDSYSNICPMDPGQSSKDKSDSDSNKADKSKGKKDDNKK